MEPQNIHDVFPLDQQGLTQPAGEDSSGSHQMAAAMDAPSAPTRMDAFKKMIQEAKKTGPMQRPHDLIISDRVKLVEELVGFELAAQSSEIQAKVIKSIHRFTSRCEQMYKNASYALPLMEKKHRSWFSKDFRSEFPTELIFSTTFRDELADNDPSTSQESIEENVVFNDNNDKSSILEKTYDVLSERQKLRSRKILQAKLEVEPPAKLIKTFTETVSVEGQKLSRNVSKDLEYVVTTCLESPTKAKKIASCVKKITSDEKRPYTAEEALALIIDRKLSVETYTFLQQDLKSRGYPALPPYHQVQNMRKNCYPTNMVEVSEREASVSLQGLLDHTFSRIVKCCEESISQYCAAKQINTLECVLQGSWGYDGSTGQSLYKQKFHDNNTVNDSCLFATTFIPLRLVDKKSGHVLWTNPTPTSFRFCRPLKIQYRKEDKELILTEKKRVEDEINDLTPGMIEISNGCKITTTWELYLTIIDGKVLNIITGTNSQLRCPFCKATSSEFNKLDLVYSKTVDKSTMLHGLSPLHAWIRVLEFLLHLGYKNDPSVKVWRVSKNSPQAEVVEERKKRIQDEIRSKMGLLVDIVRPNSGTTNDGNTARTALSDKNRSIFSDILGLEQWLLDDLHTILVVLSSGLPIDAQKFGEFCKSLAVRYADEYGWFNMPVTIHKILIHGKEIIEMSVLPVGMMSEQAGETRNKFWRYDREHHSRKICREITILDLFHRALESSDPYISSLQLEKRRKRKFKNSTFPETVLALLKPQSEIDASYSDAVVDTEMLENYDPGDHSIILESEEVLYT